MKTSEATHIIRSFYRKKQPSEADVFMYLEALDLMIEETKDPKYMLEKGGWYYEERRFDLALKYYEMAAEYDQETAYECLGYIWYYGRTGTPDYEKAFFYYSKAAEKGNITCRYKVADMYRNGYAVEKDVNRYREIIEELYPKVKDAKFLNEPFPEICTRLARIRTEQGRKEEAVDLYLAARDFLAQRIRYSGFFGNLSIMKWLIHDLYQLIELDETHMDLFDLYKLLETPRKAVFMYRGQIQTVESTVEEGGISVCFNGKWFRTVDDFFSKAEIGGNRLTSVSEELYGFSIS